MNSLLLKSNLKSKRKSSIPMHASNSQFGVWKVPDLEGL